MNNKTVSLCMIVKDEEDYLQGCIDSVKNYVNEIIIVDTGSTDNTLEIIKNNKVKLIQIEWEGNFSKARNIGIDKATSDWILVLDADERLEQFELKLWQGLLNNDNVDGYNFKVIDYLGETNTNSTISSLSLRMFRNYKEYRYSRRIHEQIESNINKNSKQKVPCAFSEVKIYHYGYLAETIKKKNKSERNIALLKEEVKVSGDSFSYYNLGSEYLRNGSYDKAIDCFKECLKNKNTALCYIAECHKKLGLSLFLAGKRKEALLFLIDSTNIYPEYTDLYFLVAEVLYTVGDFKSSEQYLKKCLEIGEVVNYKYTSLKGVGGFRAKYRLGIIAEELNDYNLAFKYYHESLKENQQFIYALKAIIKLASKKYTQKEFVSGLLIYINFLPDAKKYYITFLACLQLSYYHEATKILEKAFESKLQLTSNVITEVAHLMLATKRYIKFNEYYQLGLNQSKRDIDRLVRLKVVECIIHNSEIVLPHNVSLNESIENLYDYINNYLVSGVSCSIELNDTQIKELTELYSILVYSENDNAVSTLNSMLDTSKYSKLKINIGRLYVNKKMYNLAIKELSTVASNKDDIAELSSLLGQSYSKLGELSTSIKYLEKSLKAKYDMSTVKLLSEVHRKRSKSLILEGIGKFPDSRLLKDLLLGGDSN